MPTIMADAHLVFHQMGDPNILRKSLKSNPQYSHVKPRLRTGKTVKDEQRQGVSPGLCVPVGRVQVLLFVGSVRQKRLQRCAARPASIHNPAHSFTMPLICSRADEGFQR